MVFFHFTLLYFDSLYVMCCMQNTLAGCSLLLIVVVYLRRCRHHCLPLPVSVCASHCCLTITRISYIYITWIYAIFRCCYCCSLITKATCTHNTPLLAGSVDRRRETRDRNPWTKVTTTAHTKQLHKHVCFSYMLCKVAMIV